MSKNESNQKKQIEDCIDASDCLNRSISGVIDYLKDVQSDERYKDLELTLELKCDGYNSSDVSLVFTYMREETDQEYEDRLAQEKYERKQAAQRDAEKKQRERDLWEYMRLKWKLGR